jgi:hypothetical protein
MEPVVDVNVKKSVPSMHTEEEEFHCRAARHALVCQVNETVGSEKGKSGIAYVMNSGSLRHGYGARRMAQPWAETSVGHESTSGPIWTLQ